MQALVVAFSQGLISSLSACVYPLIPITTAIFGAGRVGHWAEGFMLSGIYVAGMSLTYVTLGLAAALGGSVFGQYMGSPEGLTIFALIFFLLGLGFLGIIPLPLPNFGDKLQVEKKESVLYPFILGIFSGFIAAPCTAPLFGALMIEIAQNAAQHETLLPGITQALSFSLGMGLPFLFIGGFALKLPKPGKWMQAIKYFGATVLFASAFHYLEDLYGPFPPESLLLQYSALGGVIFIIFLSLTEPLSGEVAAGFRAKLSLSVFLLVAAYGLFLATSPFRTTGAVISKPAPWVVDQEGDHIQHIWHDNLEAGLKEAELRNAPVLIDFWAEWCAACFKMEEELFVSEEFHRLLDKYGFALVRLDFTDTDTQEKEDIGEKYEIRGLPTLVITDKEGNMVDKVLGYRNKELSIEKIEEIMESY